MTESEHRQLIQNFLNCCVMETQGDIITHDDLEKLLDFYFNDELYCAGLSCYQEKGGTYKMLKVYKDYQVLLGKLSDHCRGLGFVFDELEINDQEKGVFYVTLKTYPSKYVRADREFIGINIEEIHNDNS